MEIKKALFDPENRHCTDIISNRRVGIDSIKGLQFALQCKINTCNKKLEERIL